MSAKQGQDVTASGAAEATAPPKVRKAKITPLPLSQMIPMTFVVLNESLCSTLLMPFIGPLVAFLRNVSVNEAGYVSGAMIGMFMLGQMISAKAWGRISDKYGRRFPIISGLFASGVMMLGFGLSTNVWSLAIFRFFHGLFNGNVLVAKTLMADITDRTNQAGGFSLVSICTSFGFLIGPALGGLLYDPANSDALQWLGLDKQGFNATHPAFLPSFVVFIYSNIGMLVCTFLVKESNPHAQPLPGFVRLIYPCMWYKSELFVPPPIQYEDDEEEEEGEQGSENGTARTKAIQNKDSTSSSSPASEEAAGRTESQGSRISRHPPREGDDDRYAASSINEDNAPAQPFSPVDHEDTRKFDHVLVEELIVVPIETGSGKRRRQRSRGPDSAGGGSLSRQHSTASVKSAHDEGEGSQHAAEFAQHELTSPTAHDVGSLSTRRPPSEESEDAVVVRNSEAAGEGEVVTKFGYREAFARPYTRFMLSQYMMLCATDMAVRECFPLWAVATVDAGGLGLSISQVSYILLLNSIPSFLGNYFFRIFERRYTNKMGLFRISMLIGGAAVLLLPFNSYINSTVMMYILVYLCTAVRQVFASWCYSLNTMLTARSAPPGHVGSIMGINQSCNALVRSIVPFIAAPIFAWSIAKDRIFPFNHVLIFCLSAAVFYYVSWRSYKIRTDENGMLRLVE